MKICNIFNRTILLPLLVIIISAAVSEADEVYSKNKKANRIYNEKRYEEALKLYDDALLLSPSDNSLKMNKGSALYRLGEFDKAGEAYTGALSEEDKKKRADAFYNLGNILFRQAQQMEQSGDQGALEKYKEALQNYIQSLDLRPDDKDAKWNLQLAHMKVKENQEKQNNQNNNQNKQDKQDKDKQNKQENQNNQDKKDQGDQNQQNKEEQDKKEDQQQENKEQQNQSDENKKQQEQKEQQANAQQQEDDSKDMKKEEAERIIELYADDADSLNKPLKKKGAKAPRPEKDW
jgi:Ca-activated chloride channel family protein